MYIVIKKNCKNYYIYNQTNFNKNRCVIAFRMLMSKNQCIDDKENISCLFLSDHFKRLYEFWLLTRSWKQVRVFFLDALLFYYLRDLRWLAPGTHSSGTNEVVIGQEVRPKSRPPFLFLLFSIIPRLVLGWNSSIKVEFTGLPVESWNILLISCDIY